ncbi:TPA: hypothetical protein ACUNF5_002742 [Burkholderia orbicola]|nr:hypothetical protein DF039_30335 [Burkholderia cenocepacia]
MNIQLATDRLAALSASAKRPKIAQLRDLFDKIDTAIRSGVRYADIIQTLDECGLHFTYPTFAAALKRIRRERGIVTSRSREARPETAPTEETPHPSPAPAVTATDAGAAPDTPTPDPAVRERRAIAPVGAKLPDDWLTADLTREQKRLLTPEHRRARAEAKVKKYWPNPFDPVPPKDENPA